MNFPRDFEAVCGISVVEINVPLSLCHRGVDALPPPVRMTWISSRSGGGNDSSLPSLQQR